MGQWYSTSATPVVDPTPLKTEEKKQKPQETKEPPHQERPKPTWTWRDLGH